MFTPLPILSLRRSAWDEKLAPCRLKSRPAAHTKPIVYPSRMEGRMEDWEQILSSLPTGFGLFLCRSSRRRLRSRCCPLSDHILIYLVSLLQKRRKPSWMYPAPCPALTLRPAKFCWYFGSLRRPAAPAAARYSRPEVRELFLQNRATLNQKPVDLRPKCQQLIAAHCGELGSCSACHWASPFAKTIKSLSQMRGWENLQ